jgi:hypothetical protein
MGIVITIVFILFVIGSVTSKIEKNKATKYLAKKYDEEKRNKR